VNDGSPPQIEQTPRQPEQHPGQQLQLEQQPEQKPPKPDPFSDWRFYPVFLTAMLAPFLVIFKIFEGMEDVLKFVSALFYFFPLIYLFVVLLAWLVLKEKHYSVALGLLSGCLIALAFLTFTVGPCGMALTWR